jgi:hypothetical protein
MPCRRGLDAGLRLRRDRAHAFLLPKLDPAERLLALDDSGRAVASPATCGGNGIGTFPRLARLSANRVSFSAATTPCVFGTSSVSRSQPVVLADVTNHFACFAPMSWSIPCLIDSAPSLAIASRGSTPFGQRSLQK